MSNNQGGVGGGWRRKETRPQTSLRLTALISDLTFFYVSFQASNTPSFCNTTIRQYKLYYHV